MSPLQRNFTSDAELHMRQCIHPTGLLTAAKALLVSQTTMLWSAIRRRSVWAPMIFTFFWSVSIRTMRVKDVNFHTDCRVLQCCLLNPPC